MLAIIKRLCYSLGIIQEDIPVKVEDRGYFGGLRTGVPMILHAKRLANNGARAFDRVKDEWLRSEPLVSGVIFKAWLDTDEINSKGVRFRVRHGDSAAYGVEPVYYIEEPTYIVSENDQYTDLFSFSKTSLEACSETMRKCGDARDDVAGDIDQSIATFKNDDEIVGSTVYYPKFGYSKAILDPPQKKEEFLKRVKSGDGEVRGFVIKVKKGVEGEMIRLVSLGVYSDRCELFFVDKKTDRSFYLDSGNEKQWADDVMKSLQNIYSSLAQTA